MLHFALYISYGQQIKLDHLQRGIQCTVLTALRPYRSCRCC